MDAENRGLFARDVAPRWTGNGGRDFVVRRIEAGFDRRFGKQGYDMFDKRDSFGRIGAACRKDNAFGMEMFRPTWLVLRQDIP